MRGIPVSGEEEEVSASVLSGREMAGCGSTVWVPLRLEADGAEDDKGAARFMTSAEAIGVNGWVIWPSIADFLWVSCHVDLLAARNTQIAFDGSQLQGKILGLK